jgi:ArsR family transcriptional regulator
MTQSNVSRHLSKLKSIKLITSSKDAQWIHYKFNGVFDAENELLAKYLKLNFNVSEVFLKDITRCKIYKNSGYNCQTITNDKDLVLRYIDNKLS